MPSKLTHHLEYHLRRNPHPLLIRFNKDPQTNPGCSILELFILGSLKPGVYFRLYFGGKNLLCKHHFSSVRQRYFHAWPWVQDLRVAIRHRTEQMGSVQLGLQSLFGVCNSKTPRISLAFCGPRKVIEGPLKALVKPCCLVHPMSKTVGKQPSSVGNLGYNAHDSCSLCCSGPKQKQNPNKIQTKHSSNTLKMQIHSWISPKHSPWNCLNGKIGKSLRRPAQSGICTGVDFGGGLGWCPSQGCLEICSCLQMTIYWLSIETCLRPKVKQYEETFHIISNHHMNHIPYWIIISNLLSSLNYIHSMRW